MDRTSTDMSRFLATVHPYNVLTETELADVADSFEDVKVGAGAQIFEINKRLRGLYLIRDGAVEIHDAQGALVSQLGPTNSFGERGLMRDGLAATTATAAEGCHLLLLPANRLHHLIETHPAFRKFFDRGSRDSHRELDLATSRVETLMTGPPIFCAPDTTIQQAAQLMKSRGISCLAVVDAGQLAGIVTTTDLAFRAVAERLDGDTPITRVMTPDPITLPPDALASDVLHMMHEHRFGHVPIADADGLKGMVTQTDMTRLQTVTSAHFVGDIAQATSIDQLAAITDKIPQLLLQLVGGGKQHQVVTRLITDIADAVTRRLLAMAEDTLGAPPVPYAWLACGSQGRREQTGVSDQDNCLLLDDTVTEADFPYFKKLAAFVCDALNACGYVYCPGDMMATNPRWCQPVRTWRGYFDKWIATPSPEAQMLASVMFDLRVIGGLAPLFTDLQAETLRKASANSIFVAHMVRNSLSHTPPLGLIGGLARIRSGTHRNRLDMKHSGVVPIVDLARIYALRGQLTAVNTRARLEDAARQKVLSATGANDLMDAYDLIAQARLEHQSRLVLSGKPPDNYLAPSDLSDFERSHLRNAFVVVKTLQSAIGHGMLA